MAHNKDRLEWHVEGTQDFTVRMKEDLAGATIASITEIKLQRRTGTNPAVWEDTGTVDASRTIVVDDSDPNNTVAASGVYWTATSDIDGDPAPGRVYRWFVKVLDSAGIDHVVKAPTEIIP